MLKRKKGEIEGAWMVWLVAAASPDYEACYRRDDHTGYRDDG